jgi:hypothetical protein
MIRMLPVCQCHCHAMEASRLGLGLMEKLWPWDYGKRWIRFSTELQQIHRIFAIGGPVVLPPSPLNHRTFFKLINHIITSASFVLYYS